MPKREDEFIALPTHRIKTWTCEEGQIVLETLLEETELQFLQYYSWLKTGLSSKNQRYARPGMTYTVKDKSHVLCRRMRRRCTWRPRGATWSACAVCWRGGGGAGQLSTTRISADPPPSISHSGRGKGFNAYDLLWAIHDLIKT